MPRAKKKKEQLSLFEVGALHDQFLPDHSERCLLCSVILSDAPHPEYRHRVMRTPRLALCEWCDMRYDVAEQDERNDLLNEFWPSHEFLEVYTPHTVALVVNGRVVDFVAGVRIEGWIGRSVAGIGGRRAELNQEDIDRYNVMAYKNGLLDKHVAPVYDTLASKLRREIMENVRRGIIYASSTL